MSLVTAIDLVAALAFLGAFAAALAIRSHTRGVGASLKYLLMAGVGLYLFVSVSNVLEHAGITSALDAYEDFAEVLFVPLVAYALYARSTSEQLIAAESAERCARNEHSLLMSVVEATPAGILVANGDGDVSLANDEARRIVGLLQQAMGGESPGADPVLELSAIVRSAPVPGLLVSIGEESARTWISVRAMPLGTEDTDVARAVVVLEDVTERVLTERELEGYRLDLEQLVDRRTGELLEVNRELEEANQSRQRFLANMSHELRTPLNSIIGFTDLLLRELPGPVTYEQRIQLGMVKESSAQLLGLVDDVLELARVESGHGVVTLSEIELGARICALIASMSALAEVRGVRLACDHPDDVVVMTDTDKLGQIVRNLVSNAIKFTDREGSVTVSVVARADAVAIAVADTGIGVAPEDQERIFEAFQQVDSTDRARPQGTGLGLAICRELSELLGYRMIVESTPGEGSTFTLLIPPAELVDRT
ncbi:MAG: ATP-binding protein [Coriobacteriia bacterium]|nr:ATP-binding protein [Coriobacteriia bacterium]